jgi:hypothetical protein
MSHFKKSSLLFLYNYKTMATRQDVIGTIEDNVTEVLLSSRANTHNSRVDIQTEDGGVLETHGIQVLVLRSDGGTDRKVQKITVKYDSQGTEVEAHIEGSVLKDYVEPASEEEALLTRFTALETAMGGEVKVSPESLKTLIPKYLVFQGADGIERVTATINGVEITRETI